MSADVQYTPGDFAPAVPCPRCGNPMRVNGTEEARSGSRTTRVDVHFICYCQEHASGAEENGDVPDVGLSGISPTAFGQVIRDEDGQVVAQGIRSSGGEVVQVGEALVFGEVPRMPLRGFPPGRVKVRLRNDEFATAVVRLSSGEGVRRFYLRVVDGYLEPAYAIASNERYKDGSDGRKLPKRASRRLLSPTG